MEEKKSSTNPTTSLGSTGYKRTLGGSTAADSGTSSGLGGRKDSANTGYLKTSSLLNTTKPSTKPPRAAEQPPNYGAFGLGKKTDEKDSYSGTANATAVGRH